MRNRVAFLLVTGLLSTAFAAIAAPPAAADVSTLAAVADSYVQADLPTSNFGTATTVKVDGSPVTVSYLRFDLQGVTPTKATLKVFTPTSSSTPINVRSVADNDWTETGVGEDGTPFERNGKAIEVVRRQADGSWKYLFDDPYGRG